MFLQSDIKDSKDKKMKKKKKKSGEKDAEETSKRDGGLNVSSQVDEYEHDTSDEEVSTCSHLSM